MTRGFITGLHLFEEVRHTTRPVFMAEIIQIFIRFNIFHLTIERKHNKETLPLTADVTPSAQKALHLIARLWTSFKSLWNRLGLYDLVPKVIRNQ